MCIAALEAAGATQRRRRRVVVRHGEEQEQGVVAVGQLDADTQLGVERVVQEMGCE